MSSWELLALAGVMAAILGVFLIIRVLIYRRSRAELEREMRQWREKVRQRQGQA